MIDADLRAVLDRALDRREDPLEDDAVQEHLLEHPEALELVERLLARLGALRSDAPSAEAEAEARQWVDGRGLQPRRRVAAAVAAFVLFGACLWVARESVRGGRGLAPEDGRAREQSVADAPGLRVLAWRMTSTVTGPEGTRRVTTTAAGRRTSVESPNASHRTQFARSETWSRP